MAFPFHFEMLSGSSEDLTFYGVCTYKYLKPEENGLAIVSTGLNFKPVNNNYEEQEGWDLFSTKLKRLVAQMEDSGQINDRLTEECCGKDSVRLIICSSGPLNLEQFRWNEELTLPMKIKLISNMHVELPRSVRERGCLYKLRQLCGAQNIRVIIQALGGVTYPRIEEPLQLQWNEVDLSWEADTQVTFMKNDNMDNFGNSQATFRSTLGRCELQLNESGVGQVLQQIYSKPAVDLHLLQAMLEEGTFSDLEIISDTNTFETPIKCHRAHLAVASPVFADMLKNSWEEAESRSVKLPESTEAIMAMLHFIYYGATERIFGASMDVVVELLQAAHKYSIPSLAEVAAFVLRAKSQLKEQWWSVDAAVDLLCFARNVEGELWRNLRFLSCKLLETKELDELKTSQGYLKLYQIAVKLGPLFEFVVTMRMRNDNETDPEEELEFVTLPNVTDGVPKEDVELIYDFMCSCYHLLYESSHVLEIIAGMVVLAEYCDRTLPQYFVGLCNRGLYQESNVDFLVELFCKANTKEEEIWKDLKLAAVRKLKNLLTSQPNTTEASEKYIEMFRTDFKAALEFTRMSMEEFVKERDRRI